MIDVKNKFLIDSKVVRIKADSREDFDYPYSIIWGNKARIKRQAKEIIENRAKTSNK